MTEEEAAQKTCHKTRGACIASQCMAWRWSEGTRTRAYMADVVAHAVKTGDNINKSMDAVWKAKSGDYPHTEGFCGIAGAPHA